MSSRRGRKAEGFLEQVRRLAKSLDMKVEDAKGELEPGKEIRFLVLAHGEHHLLATDRGHYVLLLYPMNVDPKDAELLAKQPDDVMNRLLAIIKREMLEGRSGYSLSFDEKDAKLLRQIKVEQKIVVRDDRPETLQRLADGIQEIVVTAVRCQLILGEALREVKTATQTTASDTYHAGMYA